MLCSDHALITEFDRVSGKGNQWIGLNNSALRGFVIMLELAPETEAWRQGEASIVDSTEQRRTWTKHLQERNEQSDQNMNSSTYTDHGAHCGH